LLSRLGLETSQLVQYLVALAIILVLLGLFWLVARRLLGGRLVLPGQDRGRGRQPRVGIVDLYDLPDGQRQVMLLRRDNVEHLLLIGGPNDLVIETNIVRTQTGRPPAPPSDALPERTEPNFDRLPEPALARPTVETSFRPGADLQGQLPRQAPETQTPPRPVPAPRLANGSDAEEELAPVLSASTQSSLARVEPVLKPDAVTLSAPLAPNRPEPSAAPTMPRPPVMPGSAATAPFGPTSTPRPAPPPPPVAPARPARPPEFTAPSTPAPPPPEPTAREVNKGPDAAILSDMARQLEEALRRPQPAAPPRSSESVAVPAPDDDLLVPAAPTPPTPMQPAPAPAQSQPVFPHAGLKAPAASPTPNAPAPAAPMPPLPEPARQPPSPLAAPAKDVNDPFSVEEIEAEFARLLGRPLDKGDKV